MLLLLPQLLLRLFTFDLLGIESVSVVLKIGLFGERETGQSGALCVFHPCSYVSRCTTSVPYPSLLHSAALFCYQREFADQVCVLHRKAYMNTVCGHWILVHQKSTADGRTVTPIFRLHKVGHFNICSVCAVIYSAAEPLSSFCTMHQTGVAGVSLLPHQFLHFSRRNRANHSAQCRLVLLL
uniref:Secreted protein n=1 Tax=Schistocephalus solidus TaxID=70667 RepID=A0A0X3Q794_SCHSO